ncbi:chemotaxis protein [Vibrio sp. C8]
MEMTLEVLFWTLVGCTSVIVLLQIASISKKNKLHLALLAESSKVSQSLNDKEILISQLSQECAEQLNVAVKQIQEQVQVSQAITDKQNAHYADENRAEWQSLCKMMSSQQGEVMMSFSELKANQEESFKALTKKQNEEFSLVEKLVGQSYNNLKEQLMTLKQLNERSEFTSKQSMTSLLEQITTQVQKLRADNLVSLINELAKHQELEISTDDFIKKLGDCKVTQIEDKHTGQVTHIHYQNNVKRRSDTFSGSKLKYQMIFNEDGKPSVGTEFDNAGNTIFEYTYDDAGEINKRVETIYDHTGKQAEQLETTF